MKSRLRSASALFGNKQRATSTQWAKSRALSLIFLDRHEPNSGSKPGLGEHSRHQRFRRIYCKAHCNLTRNQALPICRSLILNWIRTGVPTGIRTPVLTVKGWCPDRARRWGPRCRAGQATLCTGPRKAFLGRDTGALFSFVRCRNCLS